MARFAVDTAFDSSAPAWIATLLSLIYSTLVLFIRAYFKSGTFGKEDVVLIGAQLAACGQFVATFVAISAGVGNDLSVSQASIRVATVAPALRAGQVLYVVALSLSKLSMALLVLKIFAQLPRASVLSIGLAACAATWGVAAALTSSIACDTRHAIPGGDGSSQCPGSVSRWLAITIVDCLLEGAIFVLPSVLCLELQMSSKRKIKVATAFAFRLGCVAFSVAQFLAYRQVIEQDGQEKSLSNAAIWQQASLCYSLISATIPISMQFIARFTTGASAALGTTEGTYGSASRGYGRHSRSGVKNQLSSATSSAGRWKVDVRPDMNPEVGNSTSVFHQLPLHEERMGSQDMIIMRQDDVILMHSK